MQTEDGGYILAGTTYSIDGDVHGNHGKWDFWIVKLSNENDTLWTRTFGGSLNDEARAIFETEEQEYIIAGTTQSIDGDVHGNHGGKDFWVVKLSNTGDTLWCRTYGGSNTDAAYSVTQVNDGGYVITGLSNSNDGDVNGNHGGNDMWVIKINSIGDTLWTNSLGGSQGELGMSAAKSDDGGLVIAGLTTSNDGDVRGKHNGTDYDDFWIVKMNNYGDTLWTKTLGGSDFDYPSSIIQTLDGNYVVAGTSYSKDGDVHGIPDGHDFWIVKLTSEGDTLWTKAIGSGAWSWDEATSIIQLPDGKYVVAGWTAENPEGYGGITDWWIMKLDNTGDMIWDMILGGTSWDEAYAVAQTKEGGFVVAGSSYSNDFFVSGNHGGEDVWVVKLDPCYPPNDLSASNFSSTSAKLSWTENGSATSWQIRLDTAGFDTTGIVPVTVTENSFSWDGLSPSTEYEWYVRAVCGDGKYSEWVGPSTFNTLRKGILFSRLYGGTKNERGSSIQQTFDGGYIVAGSADSKDGDVHDNDEYKDCWIIKLDNSGDTVWTKIIGNDWSNEAALQIMQTSDSGYILLAKASGFMLAKLDQQGDTIWKKKIIQGGMVSATGASIDQTNDGGFVLAGSVKSNHSSNNNTHGLEDFWIARLNNECDTLWTKIYGGSGKDFATVIQQTSDGGFFVAGNSGSNDFDVHGNHGESDFWVLKLDTNGDTIWTKTLGGSFYERVYSLDETRDGGCILAGYTDSDDGDVHGFHGLPMTNSSDFWVVRLNSQGDTCWTRTLGGNDWDEAYSIIQTVDDGFIVAGYTNSWDGDVHGKNGSWDFWLVKLDSAGDTTWTKTFGGSLYDIPKMVIQDNEGNYVLVGESNSFDGDVYGQHGDEFGEWTSDIWVLKITSPSRYSPGTFTESPQQLGTTGHTDIALGDMDNDGDLDAVVTKDGEGEPNKVWLNNGSGNFTDSGLSFGDAKSWGIALGDLDGDGDQDGFVANIGANKVYLNSGNTNTDNGQNLGTASSRDLALADIDGDGDLDAVVANNANGQANKIWLNDGNGYFTAFTKNFGNDISWGLALGDLDGDGDIDGFIANDGPNKVYLNKGYTTTSNGQNLGNASSRGVQLGDMKGDGDLDAVVANDGAGEPNKVWLNNGKGKFIDSGLNFGTGISMAVALGDLDGDGDLDGFVANNGANKIYLNDGMNTTDNGQSLGNSNTYGVALGDLDGDGDLDAFVANYDGPCKVWINQSPQQPDKLAVAQNSTSNTLNPFSATNSDWEKEIILENYPNPFSRTTTIRFKTNTTTRVALRVTSLYGTIIEKLFDATAQAEQKYTLEFQSKDLPAGIYLIQLETETGHKANSRMMLVK